MPNWLFTVCIIGTQVVALFFSVYGIFGEREGVAPCGYPWGLAVLGISLVYFMILDVVKVQIFRCWSFEMTAKVVPTKSRKNKLANRKELTARGIETKAAWEKISK
jgi:H+-transporting ATPase